MTLKHHDAFMDEAADKVRRAILTVLPDADVTTTETAVVLAASMVLDRLGITHEDFDVHLARRSADVEVHAVPVFKDCGHPAKHEVGSHREL